MGGPNLKAPTDQMHQTAQQWQSLAATLTPEQIDELLAGLQGGQWPSQQGMAELVAALRNLQANRSAMVGANGTTLANSAGALAGADKQNAGQLGGKGQIGEAIKLGEVAGLIQSFTGPLAQVTGAVTQGISGITGSALQAAVYPLTGVLGALGGAGINANHAEHPAAPANGPGSLSPTEFHPDTPPAQQQTAPIQHRGR